jgi:hypothetical protein
MTAMQWGLMEPPSALQARKLAAAAKPEEASFWSRQDLIYLGDLQWTQWPGEGYEYIADLRAQGEKGFHYRYGLVGLADPSTVGQTLICDVRNSSTDPESFEMLVGGEWQQGPLKMWLDTLTPSVQAVAISRYRELIAWVRQQLHS